MAAVTRDVALGAGPAPTQVQVGTHVDGSTWHRFGSYRIASKLPLPALPSIAQGVEADPSVIHIDWTDRSLPPDARLRHEWKEGEATVLSLAEDDGCFWLSAPGIADFRLQTTPCRIGVQAGDTEVDAATLEHQLVDQILPRLLDHLGELVVHASALGIDGRHALFLGASGAGKSTLAGLLQRRGHAVLSDDCVQLVQAGDRCAALPTYPSLRLLADSMDALFPDASGATRVNGYSEKWRLTVSELPSARPSMPVDAVYILGAPSDGHDADIRITELPPAEACLELIRQSFRFDLGDHRATARQLSRCSAIARHVPAFALAYPHDFGLHDEIAAAIATHLAGLPAHPRR